MKWIETTNPKDPTTLDIEFTCFQEWLRLGDDRCAKYTIRFDREMQSWEVRWWHGNRGFSIDDKKHESKKEAQEACKEHLLRMKESIAV